MENNRLNNIRDNNWNTMSGILDKEMPAEKKKRRFLAWIFIIGLVVLSSAFFTLQSNHDIEAIIKPTKIQTSEKESFANKNTKKNQNPNEILEENRFAQNINIESNVMSPGKQTSTTSPHFSNLISNEDSIDDNWGQNIDNDENVISSRNDAAEKLEDFRPSVADVNMKYQSLENIANLQLMDLNNDTMQYIQELKILPSINGILILRNKEIPKISMSKPSNTAYNLGIITSAATIDFSSFSSLFVGVQGGIKLNSSFSAYSNLGWRQHKGTNINIQDESKFLDKFELSNPNVSTNQNADQELSLLIIRDITKTVNYLEIASGVKYQLFNRFALQGGFNLGYLVNESYEIDEETRGNYSGLSKEYELNYIVSNVEQSNLHQKWTAHVNVGIEARLSRSVYLYSNVHHFINKYSKDFSSSNKVNSNTNWLELGIKYNFMK